MGRRERGGGEVWEEKNRGEGLGGGNVGRRNIRGHPGGGCQVDMGGDRVSLIGEVEEGREDGWNVRAVWELTAPFATNILFVITNIQGREKKMPACCPPPSNNVRDEVTELWSKSGDW